MSSETQSGGMAAVPDQIIAFQGISGGRHFFKICRSNKNRRVDQVCIGADIEFIRGFVVEVKVLKP